MSFRKVAEIAFKAAGHAFLEVDIEEGEGYALAIIDCTRCHGVFTYDSDTRVIIGGTTEFSPDKIVNYVCPGRRNWA